MRQGVWHLHMQSRKMSTPVTQHNGSKRLEQPRRQEDRTGNRECQMDSKPP